MKPLPVNTDFNERLDLIFAAIKETLNNKSHDYCGKEDRFKNFRLSSDILEISIEEVILSRTLDKISRISQLIKNQEPRVTNESLSDSIMDLVGYSLILAVYYHGTDNTTNSDSDHRNL